MQKTPRDHGGNLDAARKRWGGARKDWIDLSTGINPVSYPVHNLDPALWTALPDATAQTRLLSAARSFWKIPDSLSVLAAPGASALIAALPGLAPAGRVGIDLPTYNEHAAAFTARGWDVTRSTNPCTARVIVHPNNPDGLVFEGEPLADKDLVVIDESFADTDPELTLRALAHNPGVVILKSFGKFWGLAGVRLGFAIALPETIARLRDMIGPWAVSGPALDIGTRALLDPGWAMRTRARLQKDAQRLDDMMTLSGRAKTVGGTPLFRLYEVGNAEAAQDALAHHKIWTRRFPYSETWLRLGLPGTESDWTRVQAAALTLP